VNRITIVEAGLVPDKAQVGKNCGEGGVRFDLKLLATFWLAIDQETEFVERNSQPVRA
jgi:hypothetical protein